jgi:drug/metabolite transporter (DMT)-like permease
MNSTAFALVVTGALLHATWNLLAKKASGGAPFVWLYGAVSLVVSAPFGIYAWLDGDQALGLPAWAAIIGSAVTHLVYSLTLQKGYQASEFSVVYPVARGSGPLFAVFGAILLLGERPTALGWLGILSIIVGILLISGLAASGRLGSERARQGIFWGALTGLSIAGYTVMDGWAVKWLGVAPVIYYTLGLAWRTVLLAPQVLRDTPTLRSQWQANAKYIVAVGVLSPLAYTLVLHAMTLAPLVYVAPARELSMLIGVAFGARLLRESFSWSRLAGTALMVVGVALLAMAK